MLQFIFFKMLSFLIVFIVCYVEGLVLDEQENQLTNEKKCMFRNLIGYFFQNLVENGIYFIYLLTSKRFFKKR